MGDSKHSIFVGAQAAVPLRAIPERGLGGDRAMTSAWVPDRRVHRYGAHALPNDVQQHIDVKTKVELWLIHILISVVMVPRIDGAQWPGGFGLSVCG
jgi:hypothetical protein